jgi:methylenetetrahydrofolate reductase (NADPH)
MSELKKQLEAGHYVVTSEIAPPKGPDISEFLAKGRLVKGRVVAVNVTDNQRSIMRLSSLIACEALLREGVEPIYQLACRDRNRLALQSDLLGAAAVGVNNVLPLTGDPVKNGDQKEAKGVFDLNSVQLMAVIEKLNQGLAFNDKPLNGKTSFFVGGAVDPHHFGSDSFKFKFEQKLAKGAQFFQSQPVYDLKKAEELFVYAQKMGAKILLGVILIKSAKQAGFLNTIPGINIPQEVIQKFEGAADPLRVGVDYAAQQCKELKPFSHGIHIMTVGREELVPDILDRAGL